MFVLTAKTLSLMELALDNPTKPEHQARNTFKLFCCFNMNVIYILNSAIMCVSNEVAL